jgi:adenylate cyclase 10
LGQCHSCHEREKVIISKVSEALKPDLPLLNELLNIQLPHSPRTQYLTSDEHTEKLHSLLFNIVHHVALTKPCVFFVDDAQWIDVESWAFLYDLASDGSALLVLGMRPFSRSVKVPAEAEQILCHPHTVHMKLQPLDDNEMVQLACIVLDVCRLPRELEQFTARCHGVPLFCKELVSSMLRHGQLNVVPLEKLDNDRGRRLSVRPMRNRANSRVSPSVDGNKTTAAMSRNVCTIAPRVDLDSVTVPSTVKEMILTRIDRQSHRNRLLMKCASVLGVVFTRNMLAGIIPDKMFYELPDAIDELVRATIFECAVAAAVRRVTDPGTLPDLGDELYCHCMATDKQDDHVVCNTLRFTETYLQETSYGLMLTDQKKYLHRRAAELMESQAHKCRYCGGGDFVRGSLEHHHAFQVQRDFVCQWGSMGLEGGRRQRAFIGQVGTKRVQKRRAFSISSSASGSLANRRPSDTYSLDPQGLLEENIVQFQQQTAFGSKLPPPAEDNLFSEIEEDFYGVDLTQCECAEVLSHVYPQLVRHYEAAGVRQKSVLYMIEAGAAAVQTAANLEAVAHLQRAKKIIGDSQQCHQGFITLSKEETARIESLLGQALFQMGHSEESMPHFYEALRILGKRQPRENQITMSWRILVEAVKQTMHLLFPNRFKGKASDWKSPRLLEQAECLAHVAHAHHLHHNNLGTMMAALQQLNSVETAKEDVQKLLEAYCVMIECCQHFGLRSLARKYKKMALSLGDSVQTTPDDLIVVAHFQSVALNMHLADGDMRLAIQSGTSSF